MVRDTDRNAEGVKSRSGEKRIHKNFPIKKKAAVPVYILTSFCAVLAFFIQQGFIPWVSAAGLEIHKQEDAKSVNLLQKDYKEQIKKIQRQIEDSREDNKIQQEKIQQIEINQHVMQTDVSHIKEGIADIKELFLQARPRSR